MSRQPHACHGFTLLELMLALALVAVLLTLLFGAFHAVAQSKAQAEARLTADEEGRALMWTLARELRGAVYTPMIPSHILLLGQANKQGGLPLDNLTVSTISPGHRQALSAFSAETLVTYSTVPNPQHRGWNELVRSQQSALLLGNSVATPPGVVLADNVLSLHFRYYNGSSWLESWDSTTAPPGQFLPQAVEIDLELATGSRPSHLSTMVSLPMAIIQR
ncbi:MAG TPA: type II secretion system protein GspJ [Candidatus Binataceae bacterium]|nr:type II secretion system protein GspJ [Candidatus Binataceae bacterium]